MSILTVPERLAKCLIDSHESIVAGYHYTQGAVEQMERPCWLVFIEDASYQNVTVDQDLTEQSYSLAYVGHIYNDPSDNSLSVEYEELARRTAVSSITYLMEHPQLQMSNQRGVFDSVLHSLNGVMNMRVDGRSGVTLYSRDAISGEAWWGFTIDVTITEQLIYETTGIS